jgi:poly-gamma-glutamate capsule biosynthesis protein CapA/YwtB (metallophosphatase superfamily)
MAASRTGPIRVFLSGDVMTGRGIDQVLPRPVNPVLYEPCVRDAREYVALAECANGPIPRPVDFAYVWGDALGELDRAGTDVRVINLETSITTSEDYWPDKEVLYRMHPGNVGCLAAARIDCCCLANNHVLDWGYAGLDETLRTLDAAGITHPGAGRDATAAAALAVPGKGRVLVASLGSTTSGIPRRWAATADRPGVHLLDDLSEATARRVAAAMREARQPGDVAVASIHWGYEIPDAQVRFARRLIDEGIDVVHGHSSHHVKGVEVYRGRLILYGCGDLLTDYEGIRGHEAFRADLALLYLVYVDPGDGRLAGVRLIPVRTRQFRLGRAAGEDAKSLADLLNRLTPPDTWVQPEADGSLTLGW